MLVLSPHDNVTNSNTWIISDRSYAPAGMQLLNQVTVFAYFVASTFLATGA